jgi:hypothetical protein
MKIPEKQEARWQELQARYPFKQPLLYYCMGVNGDPEAREQKAFMNCLRSEFSDLLGYDTYTITHKGQTIEKEVWRAIVVSTADFFDRRSGSRQMEKYMRMGYQPGTPDILLLVRREPYSGLVIEMKSLQGSASKNQRKTLSFLRSQGFSCHVCKGFLNALDVWVTYLGY